MRSLVAGGMLRPRPQITRGLITAPTVAIPDKPIEAASEAVLDVTIRDFWKR